MRASRFFISTLKEAPADAEIVSHQLMMRAGMIKRLGSGIYTYMPIGLRVIRKVEAIVREEMNRSAAVELLMPLIQPAELWQETGRWDKMGAELLRVKDRHGREFAFQPTAEEVITDVVRSEIKSYRQLPLNFYHIQTKFRDERRPRFGLMRGREFTMKDAYSFDRDVAGMQASYKIMYDAYVRIFNRFGLKFRAVAADNGAIGGTGSHEFHVIAHTGEDALVYCATSDYAANMEAAEALPATAERAAAAQALTKVATPDATKCELVAAQLGLPLAHTVKTLALTVETEKTAKQLNSISCCCCVATMNSTRSRSPRWPAWPVTASRPKKKSPKSMAACPATWVRSAPRVRSPWWPTARLPTWPILFAAPTTPATTTRAPTGAVTWRNQRLSPTCATWSKAMHRRTARAF